MLSMSKMLKIDQIYLRAVMLSMSEMSKMSNTANRCMSDVEDRSNTPKGCNAMYVDVKEDVEDVEDGKRTYTHILAHNFLNT